LDAGKVLRQLAQPSPGVIPDPSAPPIRPPPIPKDDRPIVTIRYETQTRRRGVGDTTRTGGGGPVSAPVNTSPPIIGGVTAVNGVLSASDGVWTGSPTSYTYQWMRGVPDVAPTNTIAPAITGSLSVGSTLTLTDGTWTGTPTPTFTRQWKRNGTVNIGSGTNTYVLVSADLGATISAVVTATNAAGVVPANSNTTGTITGVPATKFDSAVFHAAGIVFSNNDLTMVAPGTGGLLGAITLSGHATGKYYCEFHIDVLVTAHNWGISNRAGPPGNPMGVYDNDSCGMYSDGQVWLNGSNAPPSSGTITPTYPAQGDYVDMAVDLDNGRIWFRLNNGPWNNSGTANPATNVGGLVISTINGFGTTVYYAKWSGQGNGEKVTASFGPTYTRTKPSGFGDW
jgi:hypothetical protein